LGKKGTGKKRCSARNVEGKGLPKEKSLVEEAKRLGGVARKRN